MTRYYAAERTGADSRQVEKVYSVLARIYDGSFDWALGPGRRVAVKRLSIAAGDKVLEVGVGTGLSLPFYPPECEITGIDITEPMLQQARERADSLDRNNVDLRLMDAHELAFGEGTFDRVLAPYVISVVPDPCKVMREICRVCKPGGTVVVVNHFLSSHRLLGSVERLLTPMSRWIGFRLDLPMQWVLETPGLETVHVEAVNFLGLWHMLEMRRVQ